MGSEASTKKVNLSIHGRSGQMGQMLLSLINEDPSYHLTEEHPDVIIDFSAPEGTMTLLNRKTPIVCGTTGLNQDQMDTLRDYAHSYPVLYSPNFSLGIALLRNMLKPLKAQKSWLKEISIEETHHTKKKDAPSGTALLLAQDLDCHDITSHREGDVVGIHTIELKMEDESISMTHHAGSRKIFAQGALVAAKFLVEQPPGFYSINDLFQVEN